MTDRVTDRRARAYAARLAMPTDALAKAAPLPVAAPATWWTRMRYWLEDVVAKAQRPSQPLRAPKKAPAEAEVRGATAKWHRDLKRELKARAGEDDPASYRHATFHTGDPSTPGHPVRLVPHPTKPGVWGVHPDDRARLDTPTSAPRRRRRKDAHA